MKKHKILLALFMIFVSMSILAFLTPDVLAQSNSSIEAKQIIEKAEQDMKEMQERNIPIDRVNESLTQAVQLYNAQLALEETKKKADYKLVINYATKVSQIKEHAFKALDELLIFKEEYVGAQKEANLSALQKDYEDIESSFREERFEDTLVLINKGYSKMSKIQASQTTLNLFYQTTSRTLKNFLIENWLKIIIILIIITVALIVFGKTISKQMVKSKINNLNIRRGSLNTLIKKLQGEYFNSKKISETEYKVKLETFKEMIRDIDRQIPLLREELVKIEKKRK